MNQPTLKSLLLAQFAAESYLDGIALNDAEQVAERLQAGNNNGGHPFVQWLASDKYLGYTRMTTRQVADFDSTFAVEVHLPNTWSGFSATVLRNKTTNEYVLSFRSTEYQNSSKGGDWERDGGFNNAADHEIADLGFAIAQIADMEAFYRQKRSPGGSLEGKTFTVTGYSLGGHLATVFAQ